MSRDYLEAFAAVLCVVVFVLGFALAKASRRADDAEIRRRLGVR